MAIFPKDHLDSHGMPFWSGPKRAPDHLTFDASDDSQIAFIESMANLIAFNLGIPEVRDRKAIREMVMKVPNPTYIPKQIKVETPEEAKAREERKEPAPVVGSMPEDDVMCTTLTSELEAM
jgi:ubiquitin-activating enzyme E1